MIIKFEDYTEKLIIQKILIFLMLFFIPMLLNHATAEDYKIPTSIDNLYLSDSDFVLPSFDILRLALLGKNLIEQNNLINRHEVITIIDFSLPSTSKRLWVIDIYQSKILFNSFVSHGRNSGDLMAENFSNLPGSLTSSPGFYITGETYFGRHGLSLRLNGLEMGINDKARERSIVIHGSDYSALDFINKSGRLGRSHGCPAIPNQLSEEIIETIKDGSCLFIYTSKDSYISKSSIIKKII